jgi:hypothetical protein
MVDHLPKEQRVPWYIRLWVRLISRRATREEIEATEVSDEEVERVMAKLRPRMTELRQRGVRS